MFKQFFYLIFLFSTVIWSQKPTITKDISLSVGPKYKQIGGSIGEYYFTYGNQLLSLKKTKKAFVTQRYSIRDLSPLKGKSVLLDRGVFSGTLQLNDTLLIFYKQKNKLSAQLLQVSSNSPPVSKTFVNSTKNLSKDFGFSSRFGYDAGNRINTFVIKKSVDGTKFVILYTHKDKDSDNESGNRSLNIQVYNSDLSLDWKKSLSFPYKNSKLQMEDFMVDYKGTFYATASVFENEKLLGKQKKIEDNFHSELFSISKNETNWNIQKITTEKSLEDSVLYIDALKSPVLLGFYSEKEIKGYISGCFSAKINSDKTIKPILHPIPTDTIKAYEERKQIQIKKGQRHIDDKEDLEELHINSVAVNNDGSFNLFAEQRFTNRDSYYANGATTITYVYNYKTAYACKLSGKGDLLWFNQLPKNQYSKRGKKAMSYKVLRFGNYFHTLVWDKFSNLYKNVGEFAELTDMGKREYMFIASYKINNTSGEVKKLPVVNSLEVDKFRLSKFQMGKGVLLHNSDIIFEGSDGRGKNYLFRLQVNQ